MMKEKILITGSTGFIGKELIRYLQSKGYNLICLVRKTSNVEPLKKLKIKYIYDHEDKDKLNTSLHGVNTVVHLAGIVNATSKKEFYESNVDTTKEIVDIAKDNKVKKIIFLSTAIVTSDTREVYANTKFIAEQIIKKSGLGYVILRPSLVYGKGDKRHIGTLIDFIKKHCFIPIAGKGEYLLHPVFISDLIYVIYKTIKTEKIVNKTYTIAGPKPITFNNIIELISNSLGVKRIKIHIPLPILILLVGIYEKLVKYPRVTKEQIKRITSDKAYDISSAIRDLDFKPTDFKASIARTIW